MAAASWPTPETSGEPPAAPVALEDLRLDVLLVRGKLDTAWVEHLMSVRETWPPIAVATDGTILDGVHRAAAARRLGMSLIPAIVSDAVTTVDQLVVAAEANAGHGLRLSRVERSTIARRLVVDAPELSDRRIATIAGMSPTTVGKYRREATAAAEESDECGPELGDEGVQLDGESVQLDVEGVQLDGGGPWWRRAWRWLLARIETARRRDHEP